MTEVEEDGEGARRGEIEREVLEMRKVVEEVDKVRRKDRVWI